MSAPHAPPSSAATVDPADARWFPFDLDLAKDHVRFLHVAPAVLDASVFLDHRIALAERRPVDVARDALALPPPATPAWLFHTSFCCSTLLARVLHVAPAVEVLREPFALRRLADAANAGVDVAPWIDPVVRLLARPWHAGATTVVKPTHVALNIGPALLAAAPAAQAVLLHAHLSDFVVSNLKKPDDTKDKVGRLAARLAADAGLPAEWPAQAGARAGWAGLVAAQWLATLVLAARVLDAGGSRVLLLRDAELLADLPGQAARVAGHLALPVDAAQVAAHATTEGARHAKAPEVAYDAALRDRESAMLRARFQPLLDAALDWAREEAPRVLPVGPLLDAVA